MFLFGAMARDASQAHTNHFIFDWMATIISYLIECFKICSLVEYISNDVINDDTITRMYDLGIKSFRLGLVCLKLHIKLILPQFDNNSTTSFLKRLTYMAS